MTEFDIYKAIQAALPHAVVEIHEPKPATIVPLKQGKDIITIQRPKPLGPAAAAYGWVTVKPECIREVCAWIKSAKGIELNFPHSLSGVDYKAGEPLSVSYHFTNVQLKHWACIKVFVPRDKPIVASITDIFPGMDWHEREAFDLVGIRFEGHPNLRRILCAEDWEGHPLQKDYKFPDSYHGIPTGKEVRWNS